MTADLFERLAEQPVPPVPADLERQIHQQVNHWLLAAHLAEFVFRAAPEAARYLIQALLAWGEYTFRGRWPEEPRRGGRRGGGA